MQESQQSQYWDLYPVQPRYIKKVPGSPLNLDALNAQNSTNFNQGLLNSKTVRKPYQGLIDVICRGLKQNKSIRIISKETGLSFYRVQATFRDLIRQKLGLLRSLAVQYKISSLNENQCFFRQAVVANFVYKLEKSQNLSIISKKMNHFWKFVTMKIQMTEKSEIRNYCLSVYKQFLSALQELGIIGLLDINLILRDYLIQKQSMQDGNKVQKKVIYLFNVVKDVDNKVFQPMVCKIMSSIQKNQTPLQQLCKQQGLSFKVFFKKFQAYTMKHSSWGKQHFNQFLGQFEKVEELIVVCSAIVQYQQNQYLTYLIKISSSKKEMNYKIFLENSNQFKKKIEQALKDLSQIKKRKTESKQGPQGSIDYEYFEQRLLDQLIDKGQKQQNQVELNISESFPKKKYSLIASSNKPSQYSKKGINQEYFFDQEQSMSKRGSVELAKQEDNENRLLIQRLEPNVQGEMSLINSAKVDVQKRPPLTTQELVKQNARLKGVITKRDVRITKLENTLLAKDEQIKRLNQIIVNKQKKKLIEQKKMQTLTRFVSQRIQVMKSQCTFMEAIKTDISQITIQLQNQDQQG